MVYMVHHEIFSYNDMLVYKLQIHHNNQNLNGVSLANLVTGCPRWGAYRLLFGYYKCRGVVIEVKGDFITVAFAKNFGIKKLLKNHKSIKKI